MLNQLRTFMSSWSLDSRKGQPGGPCAEVHRALGRSTPRMAPSPDGLRAKVMDRLYQLEAPAPAAGRVGWRRPSLAAAAALAAAGGLYLARTPSAVPGAAATGELVTHIPVDPRPMIRLVAGSVDQPLLDQAQKMMDDTRRATRVVVQCIPFTRNEPRP